MLRDVRERERREEEKGERESNPNLGQWKSTGGLLRKEKRGWLTDKQLTFVTLVEDSCRLFMCFTMGGGEGPRTAFWKVPACQNVFSWSWETKAGLRHGAGSVLTTFYR